MDVWADTACSEHWSDVRNRDPAFAHGIVRIVAVSFCPDSATSIAPVCISGVVRRRRIQSPSCDACGPLSPRFAALSPFLSLI